MTSITTKLLLISSFILFGCLTSFCQNHYAVQADYDSLRVIKKGHRIKKVKYYNDSGEIRRIEKRDYFGLINGKVKSFDSLHVLTREKYKHGFSKSHLKKKGEPKKLIYFTYGLFSEWPMDGKCKDGIEWKYGYTETVVAGCVVYRGVEIRSFLNNKKNDIRQYFRFGKDWYSKMKDDLKGCE